MRTKQLVYTVCALVAPLHPTQEADNKSTDVAGRLHLASPASYYF